MYLHRRQFVIGSQQFLLNKSWKSCQLDESTWFSYCRDLRVTQTKDSSDRNWHILGLAIETLGEKLSPENEIAKTQTEQVPNLYSSWAGRWILVGNRQIHLDASGLLGCFYGKDVNGQIWASSSPALLTQILFPNQAPTIDSRRLSYEVGISWYTPPRSRFEGISRLLPSQVLDLELGRVRPRPLMPKICLERDYDEIIRQIQQILVTSLQRLAKISPELWLGLTAGYDSRLMLALSKVAQIQVNPFTRITARMSIADKLLPPQLADACGYCHRFLHRKERFPERQALVDDHSGEHISAGDAEPFICGDRDNLKGIGFGGHGFAVASGFAQLYKLPETLDNAGKGAKEIANLFQELLDSSATAGLQEWLMWILAHPEPHLNWRDRFFIEQRQAGWLSSKEQVYDLVDLVRFPILNCALLNSLLLSIPVEQRLNSQIQTALLDRISPNLMSYPFNPSDSSFGLGQIITAKAQDLPKYLFSKLIGKIRYFWRSLAL